jgi:hypothetical protein
VFLNGVPTNPYIVVSKTTNKALGIGNKTLVNAPQIMQSPATSDHHGYLGALQNQIENLRKQAADGDTLSKSRHKETDQEYKTCERFERGIGHVYAGSGQRTTEANKHASDFDTGRSKEKKKALEPVFVFPLDWALIRMDDTRVRNVTNRLPDINVPMNSNTKLTSLKLCSHWSNFNVNKEVVSVAKFGRTSGWTFGTINSCMLVINPETDAEISAVYGFTKKNPATCFGVTNAQRRFPFIERGDSGSILVHDPSGTQLGLLFGVSEGGEGMFIPMDLVHRDIRRVTGKDVVEPSFVGKLTSMLNETM